MKKLLCFFALGACLLPGWNAPAEVVAGLPAVVTGVAVVVCDSVITMGEIRSDVDLREPTVAQRFADDRAGFVQEIAKIRDGAIQKRVEDKLVLHEFVSSGYLTNVLESFIDDQIRRQIQKEHGGDRASFVKTLDAEGMTYEMYRRVQREQIIVGIMNYQNSSNPHKIIISPHKIEQYYQTNKSEFKVEDEVKLRMIVVPQPSDDPPGTAKALAEDILAKINSGVPFAEMAKVNSTDSQRTNGGDRGWVDHSYLTPALSQVAFSLKPGQRSGVMELPGACYLLQVDDVRAAHVKELKDVAREIEDTLMRAENRRLHDRWIERLRKKSFVNYY
jgi:parvulin-like peptidyl-prolyl isomerase